MDTEAKTENEKALKVSACAEFTNRPPGGGRKGPGTVVKLAETAQGPDVTRVPADTRTCRFNASKMVPFQKCHF